MEVPVIPYHQTWAFVDACMHIMKSRIGAADIQLQSHGAFVRFTQKKVSNVYRCFDGMAAWNAKLSIYLRLAPTLCTARQGPYGSYATVNVIYRAISTLL